MFKAAILLSIIAAAAAGLAPIATPLIGTLIPQPSLAPANTEHAVHVSGLTPVARKITKYVPEYPSIYSGVFPAEHIALAYDHNYVAFSAAAKASSNRISS